MMGNAVFDDETLMAYADGEADPQTTALIDQALATDEALAERLARFLDSRAAVKSAFDAQLDQPVPEALLASVKALAAAADPAQNVVSIADRRAARAPASIWRPVAVAASVALAVGLGAGLLVAANTGGPDAGPLHLAMLDDPAILASLGDLPSGQTGALPGGDRIRAIASFRDGSGAFCREFEHDRAGGKTLVAVACHDGTGWDLRLAVAAGAGTGDGYAPASSLETLDAWLASTGAGAPLPAPEEAAALTALD